MILKQRLSAFVQLGLFIERHLIKTWEPKEERFHQDLQALTQLAFSYNGWFTQESIQRALQGISHMLSEQHLTEFSASIQEPSQPKTVAVIMAGNIPAVGFHDMLCVLLSGHRILVKVSSDDPALIPFLAGMLMYYEKEFASCIHFSEAKLSDFEAVIATGSNNSATHFKYYFGKYPHIIRKSRTSLAILTGNETTKELAELGKDVFYYFGLGCRNVSKLYVPKGYNFNSFFEAIYEFKYVLDHKKYHNNYEYNRAIYLLDLVPFLDNNFVLLKESHELHAPTAVVHYEFYTNEALLVENIKQQQDNLQCIVCNFEINNLKTIKLGETQVPTVFDFADHVNTLDFLKII